MSQLGYTSLVINAPYAKQLGVPPYYYRVRSCDTNLTGSSPADQYQRLKQIQNTVRVYGSLYTANLGPLSAYTKAISDPQHGFYGVCWNQMSDRPYPSFQPVTVPTGYNNSLNTRRSSVTSSRPGCQTPGGAGCDIKHNSYDRYLNRLKGKGPLRRGVVPPGFGTPVPFNPAFPIYGGKTMKTNIVNTCNCPDTNSQEQNERIYSDPLWQPYPSAKMVFKVGDTVYAVQKGAKFYSKATVVGVSNEEIYTIMFENGTIQLVANISELLLKEPCNSGCGNNYNDNDKQIVLTDPFDINGYTCVLPENLFV